MSREIISFTSLTLCFLILIVFINPVMAQTQTLGGIDGYSPGEEINLIQICTNCTFVNITTIRLGNDSLLAVNSAMTKDGTFYNHTLAPGFTTPIGDYIVNWVADPNSVEDTGSYNFHVRKAGVFLTSAESFLYIMLLIVTFIASFFFLYFGFILPYTSEVNPEGSITRLVPPKYLKLLSIWIGYGSLMWFMSILSLISNSFISIDAANTLISNLYLFLFVLSYPLTFIILSILFIQFYIDLFIPVFKLLLNKFVGKK